MEELLEVTRKQLKLQKIITICLAVMVVLLLAASVKLAGGMNELAAAVEVMEEKVEQLDLDGINDAIESTGKMLESVNEFSKALDGVTTKVKDMESWFTGILGN